MTPNEYQELAARTECSQRDSLIRMAGCHNKLMDAFDGPVPNSQSVLTCIRVNHSIIGLSGEVGELASLLQKKVYYGKEWTKEEFIQKMKEEYGDVLWYVAEGLNALGLKMEDVMQSNIRKLQVRYPDKYTDFNAEDSNRDRDAEAKAM